MTNKRIFLYVVALGLFVGIFLLIKSVNKESNTDHSPSVTINENHGNSSNSLNGTARKVEIAGLSRMDYQREEINVDLNRLLFRYNFFDEGRLNVRLKGGLENKIDLFFNEENELVHLAADKNLYKTKDRSVEAIERLIQGSGLEIDAMGIPNLTLENKLLMRWVLSHGKFSSVSGSAGVEREVTPLMIRVTESSKDWVVEKWGGKVLPAILLRLTKSRVGHDENYTELAGYGEDEYYRRRWKIIAFNPDQISNGNLEKSFAFHLEVDEPKIEAFKRRKTIIIRDRFGTDPPQVILDER